MSIFKFTLALLILLPAQQQRIQGLVFTGTSALQVTGSISVPVNDLPPYGKIYFDWGLQVNYDLPMNVSAFYNVPTFPELYGVKFDTKRDLTYKDLRDMHKLQQQVYDFTALEVYKAIEGSLKDFGFHESCLMLSICELASKPFEDPNENFLSSMLQFVLTPSLNEAYARADEAYERRKFQHAERYGLRGRKCSKLYPDCMENILDLMTSVFYN